MEKANNTTDGKAMQFKHPILVAVIHDCSYEGYWYKGWNGQHISVIEFPDYFAVHADYVDRTGPYRMIDKGDATIVGRLTATPEEELIFSERLAHDPQKEFNTLMGKKMPDLSKYPRTAAFMIPGERMHEGIIADAKRNVDDLDTDNEIAKALADIYGMRAALQAVMYWFNKDHVSTPQWIYELVASRINKSESYGITNVARAMMDIEAWKKDFPNWHEQEKEHEFKSRTNKFDIGLLEIEHEMLMRIGDFVEKNFPCERDFGKENIATFVISLLERYKRLRSGDLNKQLFEIEEYLEVNFPDDLQTETTETVTALLMELRGRRMAMKDTDTARSETSYERIKRSLTGDHTSDAFRYATHEFTKTKLDGYEALMTFLEKEFPNEWDGDTAGTKAMKLLIELRERRNNVVKEEIKLGGCRPPITVEKEGCPDPLEEMRKGKEAIKNIEALYDFLKDEFPNHVEVGGYQNTLPIIRELLLKLKNYEKINKLQGMPLHPLLNKNEELAAFLLKEFPNDPGRFGEEPPIDVAIRLLTEYAHGWNVGEGLLHFLGWFTSLEQVITFASTHSPYNMVPLVKSFLHANRLPELRRDPAFYLNQYKKEKS